MHQPTMISRGRAASEPNTASRSLGFGRVFTRDQQVYARGDSADHTYNVVSGAVRSYRLISGGRRQIGEFYLPGDVFGLEFGKRRQWSADTLGDAVIIVAPWPERGADSAMVWRQALAELRRSEEHVLSLGRRSATERIASFLLEMSERLGAEAEFRLPMTRQDMGDYLGLTIESVSRTMTQLQAEGLIALRNGRRVRLVRRTGLAELCE